MTTAEVLELPTDERLMLMETIWDSLCREADTLKSPLWHKHVLDERMAMVKEGKADYLTIDEIMGRPL